MSHRVLYEWSETVKDGHISVTDAEHSGYQITATSSQNEEKAWELILQNRSVTVDKTAKRLNTSIGSAYSVVHNILQFH
jgi:hypothetical protein